MDLGQIPGSEAQTDALQGTVAGRDLEAPAVERNGAVGSTLSAADFGGEGAAQRVAVGGGPADRRALEVSVQGGWPVSELTLR